MLIIRTKVKFAQNKGYVKKNNRGREREREEEKESGTYGSIFNARGNCRSLEWKTGCST